MKIAIVHEMLIKLWGAEKVVENWMQNYPHADIFTLIYDENKVGSVFPKEKIHPQVSSLKSQKIYKILWKQRFCLPFMSRSVESLDLSWYDVILISSSWFAHGVVAPSTSKTIVYYHSPARYLWDWTNEYKRDISAHKWIKWYILNSLFVKLRQWDYEAGQKHMTITSNSGNTSKRIQKYYKRVSETLYPPIETQRFAEISASTLIPPYKNYYIILSALTEFKKLDIAIMGFQKTPDINLVIIGDGDYKETLVKISKGSKNISFVGAQFWDDLVALVQWSQGLIFPWEEDFGIVPIEVMAAGKPVFALEKGWLTETVIAWKTGEFFTNETGSDFVKRFQGFHNSNLKGVYTPENCKKQAQKFDKNVFEKKIDELLK